MDEQVKQTIDRFAVAPDDYARYSGIVGVLDDLTDRPDEVREIVRYLYDNYPEAWQDLGEELYQVPAADASWIGRVYDRRSVAWMYLDKDGDVHIYTKVYRNPPYNHVRRHLVVRAASVSPQNIMEKFLPVFREHPFLNVVVLDCLAPALMGCGAELDHCGYTADLAG